MQSSDLGAFRDLMDAVMDSYGRPHLSDGALVLDFQALSEHSFAEVARAVVEYKKDPVSGRFCPTSAHLIAQIRGPQPDPGRVMPNAYLPYEPEDRYALPALPLSPEEQANLAAKERERLARLEEERRETGKRIRALRDRLGDVAKPFPQERQREGGASIAAPASSEPLVRVRADGTLEGKCSDGRWLPMERQGGKS